MGVDDAVAAKTVGGVVAEQLPSALFRVTLGDGSDVLAHVSERRSNDFLRLLPGDKVEVRLSPYDGRRGRIVKRSSK